MMVYIVCKCSYGDINTLVKVFDDEVRAYRYCDICNNNGIQDPYIYYEVHTMVIK